MTDRHDRFDLGEPDLDGQIRALITEDEARPEVDALLESGEKAIALVHALGVTGLPAEMIENMGVYSPVDGRSYPTKVSDACNVRSTLGMLMRCSEGELDLEAAAAIMVEPFSDAETMFAGPTLRGHSLVEMSVVDPGMACARALGYLDFGTAAWPLPGDN